MTSFDGYQWGAIGQYGWYFPYENQYYKGCRDPNVSLSEHNMILKNIGNMIFLSEMIPEFVHMLTKLCTLSVWKPSRYYFFAYMRERLIYIIKFFCSFFSLSVVCIIFSSFSLQLLGKFLLNLPQITGIFNE